MLVLGRRVSLGIPGKASGTLCFVLLPPEGVELLGSLLFQRGLSRARRLQDRVQEFGLILVERSELVLEFD